LDSNAFRNLSFSELSLPQGLAYRTITTDNTTTTTGSIDNN